MIKRWLQSLTTYTSSLRLRLIVLFALVLVLGGGTLLWAAESFARRAADQVYDKLLASAALAALERLSVIEDHINFDLPYATFDMLSLSEHDRVVYRLMREDQTLLTGYDALPLPDPIPSNTNEPFFFTLDYDGEPFRFIVMRRLLIDSKTHEWVWFQLGQSRLARSALEHDMVWRAIADMIGLSVIGWFFVWLAARWSLAPLMRVQQALAQRQSTDLSPLLIKVPREAAPLVAAINHFMARLQRNQDRNHAFIAEAAHQLRTPLASLQAQAELAADETDSVLFKDRAERIRRNAKETTNRINQLLSYATLAHRADVLSPERIVLEQCVINELANLAAIAMRQGVELNFDNHVGEVQVLADPEAIREVLRNLVDNALKYGQINSTRAELIVSIEPIPENTALVMLQVRDFGQGLTPEQIAQVMTRFGRGEFNKTKGSGLGLAIVDQIVRQMGGELVLTTAQGGGLAAQIWLKRI